MQTVPARLRPTLTLVCNTEPQVAFGAVGETRSEPSQADIVRSAPYAWAMMADVARRSGELDRAEELISLAYMAYDILGSTEWTSSNELEADWEPSDISVDRSSVFA